MSKAIHMRRARPLVPSARVPSPIVPSPIVATPIVARPIVPNPIAHHSVLARATARIRRAWARRHWFLMYTLGRFKTPRRIALWIAPRLVARRESNVAATSLFENIDAAEVTRTLRQDGFRTGFVLPREAVLDVLDFANRTRCYIDRHKDCWFNHRDHATVQQRHGEPILIGRYANSAAGCPAIARLQKDPLLIDVARQYLRSEPVHLGNRLWWSFVNDSDEQQRRRAGQGFHYDLDDWGNVTFFFYLTDVTDVSAGPHMLVRGSHTRRRLKWRCSPYKSRTERELVDYYGQEAFVTLPGAAGFGFVEDLFCFHKGIAPSSQPRLILQVRFGLHDYGNANDLG